MRRQAEALQRAYLDAQRERDEVLADIISAIVQFDARQAEATAELSDQVNAALARLTRGLGGPPPLPDVVGEFADAVRHGQGYRQ